jgi:AraC-like DNA-binding protein
MFKSWTSDLKSCEGETIALLEAHAVTRRALRHHLQSSSDADENQTLPAATGDCMMRITTMAQFMTTHFRQNISMSDIASSAHLSPNYAMTLFRDMVGTTLGNYLTRCRVAEAQRLLITTSMTTLAIAHAAGFGSQSSFYDHFTRLCGSSPGTYRRLRSIP